MGTTAARLVCLLACCLASVGVWAQAAGSINGIVTDASGAVVTGAEVSLTGAGGVSRTATTNAQGKYTLQALPLGVYSISIAATGFATFKTDNLNVEAGEPVSLDATLELAKESTNVNVEGGKAAEVETETSEVSGTITQTELVKLGLNGRNFTQLITLAPGVSNQTGQDEAKVGVQGSAKYSVNGGRVEYNTFELDGSDILNTGINASRGTTTLIVYPSLDALSEVKILTSNYGAMYGRTASGTVLATTKSGGQSYHGNLYEFVRNEALNARNYFDPPGKAPLYRRNDFGFTLGGPFYIPGVYPRKKSHTFFFVSEEWRLEKTPTPFNHAVPSVAERQGIFNDVCPTSGPIGSNGGFLFSRQKYPDCPAYNSDVGTGTATGYPGNVVPVSWFGSSMLGTGIIPLPNSTTGCNSSIGSCYVTAVSPNTYWHQDLFRIDQDIGSKMKLMLRYVHDAWNTTTPIPQWELVQNSFPTIQNSFTGPGTNAIVQLTQTISPSLLNQLSFSYGSESIALENVPGFPNVSLARPASLDAPCSAPDPKTGYVQCPMGVIYNNGFGGKAPGIVIAGSNAAYGGSGFAVDSSYMPWNYANPTYALQDNVSKALGKHTLQFGAQIVWAQQNELSAINGANIGDVQGLLTYSNVSSVYSTGNAFADFLIGPTNAQGQTQNHSGIQYFRQDSTQLKYYSRYTVGEPYVQDDWRVTPRLTINVGLRLSLFGLWHEKYNNAYNWNPAVYSSSLASQTTVDPATGSLLNSATLQPIPLNLGNLDPRITNGLQRCGVDGVPAGCMSGHLFNPAPRIGLAWDPFGDGQTSIRAGYGIFFHHGTSLEANTGSLIGSAPLVLDMTQNQPFTVSCISGGRGQPNCASTGAFPLNVTEIPTSAVWPYVQQWSLSIERQLSKSLVASVAYVGSKGTHLTAELQVNQLIPLSSSQNPFDPGQPLTAAECNTYGGSSFRINNQTITAAQPAFINLLAACYGTIKSGVDPNALREYAPGIGQILSLANIADSDYNALQMTLRRTVGPVYLSVAYTYSHSIDDSSDRADATFVNSFDLSSNKASSNFDQRQLLNIGYVWQDPFLTIGRWFSKTLQTPPGVCYTCDPPTYNSSGGDSAPDAISSFADSKTGKVLRTIFSNWEFSGITTFQSGIPFSVINGGSSTGISVLDNAGVANGQGAGSYPDLIGNPKGTPPNGANNSLTFGPALLNAAAFAAPQGLTFGTAGRNALNNPSRTNFDMSLIRNFKVWSERNLEFRIEAFNVFNHTQFRIYDPLLGNTANNTISCYGGASVNYSAAGGGGTNCLTGNAFLHPVDAHNPRIVQLGAKFSF